MEKIFFDDDLNNKNIPTNKRIYIFEDIDCVCDIIKCRDEEDFDFIKKNKETEKKIKSELEILSRITNNMSERKINDVLYKQLTAGTKIIWHDFNISRTHTLEILNSSI